jgi:outer membrane protein assembly factor BamB
MACRTNRAPPTPTLTGPSSDTVRAVVEFGVSTVDPDGDSVSIIIDWADGGLDTTDLCPSGVTVTLTHAWRMPDAYAVRAMASDCQNHFSKWSSEHVIMIDAPPGTVLWSMEVGYGNSAPAVGEDGTVYVGNDAGTLFAIKPDGTVKWEVETWAGVTSPTIGADWTVYAASGGWLRAFTPNGAERWASETGGGTYSSPALGPDGTVYTSSEDRCLYALNPDGSLRWRKSGRASDYPPAIGADGTIYVNTYDTLFALDAAGTTIWSYCPGPGTEITAPPALGADGTVYIAADVDDGDSCCSGIHAVGPEGQERWRYGEEFEHISGSPVVGDDGTIYYGVWFCDRDKPDEYGAVHALRPDGSLIWSAFKEDITASPALGSDGNVYVVSETDSVCAISREGVVRWKLLGPAGTEAEEAPAIGRGVLYTVNDDGYLSAISIDGDLADAPWPMFMHDAQHTCRAR